MRCNHAELLSSPQAFMYRSVPIYSIIVDCVHIQFPKLYAQDGLQYESKFCPKQDCGSPMMVRWHKGVKKMQCTKQKCKHLTRDLVSVYYHQSGTSPLAVRSPMHHRIISIAIQPCHV